MTVTKNSTLLDPYGSGGSSSTAFTTPATVTLAVAATSTDGLILKTDQTATAGNQKFSPALHFQGSGWKTDATAGAQSCDWKVEVQPVQGAASPDGKLVFSSSVNGGAYTARWIMDEVTAGASYGFFPGANSNTGLIPWTNNDLVVGVLASYHWRFTPASSGAAGTPVTFMGGAANVFGWASSGGATNTIDTGLSRISAGVVGVGTGAAGSTAGSLDVSGGSITSFEFKTASGGKFRITTGASFEINATYGAVAASGLGFGFNASNATAAPDTNLSRISAGVVGVGTGAAGSEGGTLRAANLNSSVATGSIGFITGAGGTVTQATSKATAVTLSKPCGAITLHTASIATNTSVSFVMTCTAVAAGDVMILNHISGGTINAYALNSQCGAGVATINVRNLTAAALGEAITIQYVIVKAVTA